MADWLDTGVLYWHWLVLGVLLAVLEIIVPTFFLLWLGVSAVVVGLVTFFIPVPLAGQLLLWGALSLACLVVWFTLIAPRFKNVSLTGMAREQLLGQIGTVLSYSGESHRGVLRFSAPIQGADEWRFICPLAVVSGDRVRVVDTSGNDLIVTRDS